MYMRKKKSGGARHVQLGSGAVLEKLSGGAQVLRVGTTPLVITHMHVQVQVCMCKCRTLGIPACESLKAVLDILPF